MAVRLHPITSKFKRRGKAPNWLPTNINGCVLWLRSDLGAYQDAEKTVPCTADSLIWTGADQSGNGNDAIQATEAKRFVYKENILDGHPSWRSDGIDDYMAANGVISVFNGDDMPFTVFMVAKFRTFNNAWQSLWNASQLSATTGYIRYMVWNDGVETHCREASTVDNVLNFNGSHNLNFNYWIINFSGIATTVQRNGSVIIDNAACNTGPITGIDSFILSALAYLGGYIQLSEIDWIEMGIYDNEISAADMTLLNNYAAARYPSI